MGSNLGRQPSTDGPERVGFLLVSGFSMLAYVAAIESLRAANQIAGAQLYSWRHVGCANHASVASNGVEIKCEADTSSSAAFDYVFVCASDPTDDFRDPAVLAWLRAQAARGAVMGGISGGAVLLARAGLLVGRRVTTHWVYAPSFGEEFPEADLRRSLYEIDGDRMTCAGGMAPLDMLHAVLREKHGEDLAVGVSEWFLHTDIRDGQRPQRLSFQARLGVNHPGLIRVLEAMENALEEPLSRTELAEIAATSQRQLDRLFLTQIGTPLSAYYLGMRLERARQLVTRSSLSLLEIAIASGFKSSSTFSKSYRAQFGLPPSADRAAILRPRHKGG